ncbi:MAG: HipA family kinase [Polyangiales bacterium]
MRTVRAIRYVKPFKQGGSVPALVEGDDDGMYVTKLRGASQGEKTLIAEVIAGEIGRALSLPVPELVYVDLDASIAEAEPDPELCLPLEKSVGLNLGLDFLPGSVTFDPLAGPWPDASVTSRIVLFDAFVANVDRTARNANILTWHRAPWLIDHGAALYFHHGWRPDDPLEGSDDPFAEVRDHVLLRGASALREAEAHLAATLDDATLDRIVDLVPDAWLAPDLAFDDVTSHREAYRTWLRARRSRLPLLRETAEAARG